MRIEQAVDR
ncbi:Protein of unknown function [Thermobacillus xylanilyticus]|uniref:Uncharacterized protein n=1 Tax=Thermobacillus xylanilyticus TaxID=76633 RepID=A0ABM8V6G7_THEXY|nr:Protein of unknown function [Thermobacillus xylanilyticus]